MRADSTAALNVLLVDADAASRRQLRRLLLTLPEAARARVDEAADAQQALHRLAAGDVDLLLLDTALPGVDGLQLAAELQRRRAPGRELPAAVFVTASAAHALAAFELGALDYLLKPPSRARLRRMVARVAALAALASAAAEPAPDAPGGPELSVRERGALTRVALADVLYFSADHKYTLLRTLHQRHLIDTALDELERRHRERFVRAHRAALVARDALVALHRAERGWTLRLRGIDDVLPVARRRLAALRALLR
ncbi:transcriptional regulatory protein YpdB [mine drainage metagenome]|uniref:Transcriptional regulatory protein YpdB n=1 Tax=mine drainage metagenome TaxID=410659 RepID=A0A1J5QH98_9ZZZZ